MSKNREILIAELSDNLTVSSRAGRTIDIITLWLVFNFATAILLIWYTGPFRAGSLQQVHNHPQFLLESLTGLLAIIMLGVSAIRSGIPANISSLKQYSPALLLLLIWISFYVVGLWSPALEPSMLGKRAFPCYLQTMAFGLPSMMMGLYLVDHLCPLHGARTGLMIGLVAGATPALIMQFACMYAPSHIIIYHLIPGLLLGVVGYFAGEYYLTKE